MNIKESKKLTLGEIFADVTVNHSESAFDRMLGQKFESFGQIFNQLDTPDELTDELFGKPDQEGKVAFPFAVSKVKEGVVEFRGRLGDQTSVYHKETLKEHTLMVVARLIEAGVSPARAVAIGVLHDCAKKYTLGTNAKGEVCYYGHSGPSALLAAHWLTNMGFPESEMRFIVSVVYAHMFPKVDWAQKPEQKPVFHEELKNLLGESDADEAMALIELFDQADQGCKDEDYSDSIAELIQIAKEVIV